MRVCSLGRLAGGLLTLAVAAAPCAVSAQPVLGISCLGDDTSGTFEIGVVMQTAELYTIVMFDMVTGTELAGSRQNVNSATLARDGCQYRAYGGPNSGQGDDPAPVTYQSDRLYRIDMFPADPASVSIQASFYTYTPASCVAGSNVFCPKGYVFQDMVFFVTSDRVRTYPNQLPGGFGPPSRSVEEYLGEVQWVLPYDSAVLCTAMLAAGTALACDPEIDDAYVFVTPAPFGSTGPSTLPVVLTAANGADWRVPAGRTYTWSASDVSEVRFGASGRLTVRQKTESALGGVLNVTPSAINAGLTLTASNGSAGWDGVWFESGSGGAWARATVERVAGSDPSGFIRSGLAAVTVDNAAPTFANVTIQEPVVGTELVGLKVTGTAAAPVATALTVTDMTARGIVINGGARLDLFRGTITGSDGPAIGAAGTGTRAFLRRALTGDQRGPQITGNEGGGVAATSSAEVRFGTDNAAAPGYGYGSVTGNGNSGAGGRGLSASTGADIYAGTGTVAAGFYQRNRVFDNFTASTTGNALASGTGSTVYARCAWWNTTQTSAFRVGAASGGLTDAGYYLTSDPYTTATPECTNLSIDGPENRPGTGTRSVSREGSTAARGTPESESDGLDRLAEAMSAATSTEAVALLTALVADLPETEAATAALGEAGGIAARAGAPASAIALVTGATESPTPALRVAAWQALVASRHAAGDLAGALAAADALALDGAAVQAEIARVYLHAEAADTTAALAALAALDALAPGSVEAELARAFIAPDAAPMGKWGDTAPRVSAPRPAEAPASVALAVGPNPAGTSASVLLRLAEASDVTVTVYDLLGRAVATPLSGTLAAGEHRAGLDVSRLAPGVYVVRAVANTAAGPVVQTARLTVTR